MLFRITPLFIHHILSKTETQIVGLRILGSDFPGYESRNSTALVLSDAWTSKSHDQRRPSSLLQPATIVDGIMLEVTHQVFFTALKTR